MQTYIAFLRAINVGGHNVSMERLRGLFAELGLANVRTFIQTGNVFFEWDGDDRAALTLRIETHMADALGYAVPAFLRTIPEIEAVIARDAFAGAEVTTETRLAVMFLSAPLPADVTFPLGPADGGFAVIDATPNEAYIVARHADGRVPNPAAFVEKKIGVKTTSRFLATTERILAAAKGGSPSE